MTETPHTPRYHTDILGDGYQQLTLHFPDDYDGPVVATLIRKKGTIASTKAVLYIHGFMDYFFQTEMAERFNQQGYDFYALDLRKYGRSKRAHQTLFTVHDLREYDPEISKALQIIGEEGHDQVILAGHSTGGLICTLYAAHHPFHPLIKALWLNSPFYDFSVNLLKKKVGLPLLSKLGAHLPNVRVPSGLNIWYVPSLHRDFHGEWDFNILWKPKRYSSISLGFIHAIHEAQKELRHGLHLPVPTLVMHAHQSYFPKKWGIQAQKSDLILDVKDIERMANKLQGDVTVMTIHNGMHDLVLSGPTVRDWVYQQLFSWLSNKKL